MHIRESYGNVYLVFDVGVITDVKNNQIFVDYKMEGGIISVPLQSKDFNCSIAEPP
jgi:hypothetical protein